MIRLFTCFALCGVLTAACGIDGAPRPPKAVAAERQKNKAIKLTTLSTREPRKISKNRQTTSNKRPCP